MKTIAVVYSSKYGHTKQYADWLKEDVDADAIDIGKFNITQMLAYKLVIFACGVYGDKLSIMDFVKKNVTAIPAQKTMIMAVGWYTNDSKEAKEKLIEENYPPEFKGKVPMYVVNSGINKKQISKVDSVKLVAAKLAIEKKDGRSTDDINALGILNGYSDPTSKDNLASIKKGIDEFLNPPQPAPEPKAAPAPKTAPAAKAAPAPKPAAKPANAADALADSVEEAFKHLGAKPVINKPEPPKPEPKAEAPAPAPAPAAPAEEESAEPVIKFNANGKVVVSSVLDAINSLNGTPQEQPVPKPAPAPEPKPEPAAEVKPAPVAEPKPEPVAEVKPAPVPEPKPEPAAEVKPAPVPEPKPEPVAEVKSEPMAAVKPEPAAESTKKSNSYMELFAKKRRASAEEAPKTEEPAVSAPVQQAAEPAAEIPAPKPESAPAPKPEPVPAPAPIPRPGPTPDAELDFGDFDLGAAASTSAPAPAPAAQPAPAVSGELDLDSYDFIGESKPAVSSRALNAVQALAKAKEDAEKEAAQKAAEQEQERAQSDYSNAEEQGFETSADDDDGIIVEAYDSADYEEESDGLEAFEFTNDFDYDVEAELDLKPMEPEPLEVKHESKNNLDIKKLQDEITASIESNRAAKEKMMARYSKKKEEVHNPFAVQFDEEDDKDKKKKKPKKAAPEPKFLDDPIDPDIFFSKPNKDMDFNTGSMPEIKFKH